MNWLKKLFGIKEKPRRSNDRKVVSRDTNNTSNLDNDVFPTNDLLNPLNPLNPISPISIWNSDSINDTISEHSSYDNNNYEYNSSYTSDTSSYDTDSSSSGSPDW